MGVGNRGISSRDKEKEAGEGKILRKTSQGIGS